MDDRIAALEQKVAALGSTVERNEIGRFALRHVLAAVCAPLIATTGLGPIDIQDSQWESVLIHCASDQLIRSAADGETIRAQ